MNVGVIGLGNMGGRIAKRLMNRGCELSVFDTNSQTIQEFGKLGARVYPSPQALAYETDVVITVLPDASVVQQVVLAEDGLLSGFAPGSTLIDMTTSIPKVTKEIGKVLREKQVNMLDAPVSGGVKKAEVGELSIMVGGEESVLEGVLPLLKNIGTTISHVGELGAGHTIKALNNLICATTLGITAEALAVGVKMGLEPDKMLEVINASSGRSHSSEVKFPQQVLTRKFEVGFTIDLMRKDVDIALSLAKSEQVPVTIANSVSTLWNHAVNQGNGSQDHTAIARFVEQLAGVEIKAYENN